MTNTRLHHINPVTFPNPLCRLCNLSHETIPHIFQHCDTLKATMHTVLQPIVKFLHTPNISQLEILFPFTLFPKKHLAMATIYIGTFLWAIWRSLWQPANTPVLQQKLILQFFKSDWALSSNHVITKLPPETQQSWAQIHIPDP